MKFGEALWAGIAFSLSVIFVGVMREYALQTQLLDKPNRRSSHSRVVPRGGGIGLVAAFLVTCAAGSYAGALPVGSQLFLPSVGLGVLAVIGLLDDRHYLPATGRLAVHIIAATTIVALAARRRVFPPEHAYVWWIVWMAWTVGSINVVNFMDGIDGLVASQAAIFSFYLATLTPEPSVARFIAIGLGAACVGFLVWNWAPAKIFLGDAGSVPLGFMMIGAAIFALPVFTVKLTIFLPLFPLFFDALATMALRKSLKHNLVLAHRCHVYQRMVKGGFSHSTVSLLYGAAAIIGAVISSASQRMQTVPALILVLAYCAAVMLIWFWLSGRYPVDDACYSPPPPRSLDYSVPLKSKRGERYRS